MSQSPIVLIAAADAEVLRALIGQFPRGQGWMPMAARAQTQVERVLSKRTPHVAIVHQNLEDTTGLSFCEWLGRRSPSTIRIMLTHDIPGEPDIMDPYDAALRHPAPPGLLLELVVRQLREQQAQRATERFLVEVQQRVEALDGQDYYAILGLTPEQGSEENLRRMYDGFNLRYHPDRHMHLRGTPGHTALTVLIKHIGEAYRVLTHEDKRRKYDRGLAQGVLRFDDQGREKKGPKALGDLSEVPAARRFLRLAQTALAEGQFGAAVQNLKFALSMDGDNPEIKEKLDEIKELV